jgi:ABC-type multidrug transport system permease subunit
MNEYTQRHIFVLSLLLLFLILYAILKDEIVLMFAIVMFLYLILQYLITIREILAEKT